MCVGRRNSDVNIHQIPHQIFRTSSETVFYFQRNLKKVVLVEEQQVAEPRNEFKKLTEDVLDIVTEQTKYISNSMCNSYQRFLSLVYKIIQLNSSQPAHLITALSVLYIAYLCFPNKNQSQISPIWTLIYLVSFSTHFGAQIWMTFVSGISLYFNLPRHVFGSVQKVLFPKYFSLNSVLTLITLAIFVRTKNQDLFLAENAVQASGMSACFLIELTIRLYLTPLLLKLSEKDAIERKAGVGMEIGESNLGNLTKCPHYLKMRKSFRKLHSSIALLNCVTLGCRMLHLYYLSHKICSI